MFQPLLMPNIDMQCLHEMPLAKHIAQPLPQKKHLKVDVLGFKSLAQPLFFAARLLQGSWVSRPTAM
jgi:hypothetical protein